LALSSIGVPGKMKSAQPKYVPMLGKNCLGKNYSRFEYFLFLKPNVFPAMGTLQMTSRVSWTCGLGTACSRAGNRANLWWFLVILAKDSC
jgi:hypothetical protein